MRNFLQRLQPVWAPHAGQREFLLNPARIKVLACGRRWGKTDASAAELLASLCRPGPTRQLILAPTLDQARLLFERTVELLDGLARHEGERPSCRVRRSPYPHLRVGESVLMARSGHVGRSLRGNEATHIVVDEAAFVPEELVTEVAMPMLATTDGQLTLISTPRGKNHFWRFFRMGERREHGVWARRSPSAESPHVSERYLAIQRELVSDRVFRVEYEAEFLDGAGRVFRSDAVDACLVAELEPCGEGPFAIGVDWARYGDYTAVAVLSGNRGRCSLVHLERFHGLEWVRAVARVADVIRRFPHAAITCDATGVGDPVVEMLQREAPTAAVEGLVFSQRVKADLIEGLAWLFERASLRMTPDPNLLRELEYFEATPSASGATRLAAAGGAHDDLVTALALAAWKLPHAYRPVIAVGAPRRFSAEDR